MRQILGRSTPLLIAVLLVGGYAVAETSQVEHTFCVNKKSKAVTYGSDGKCPKGSDPIKVGTPLAAPGATGKASSSSYNAVLKDASGAVIDGVIQDGVLVRDGYVWSLDYGTGEFRPGYTVFPLYLGANCTGEMVASIYGGTFKGAEKQLRELKTYIASGYLLAPFTGEGKLLSKDAYTLSNSAKLVDNRRISDPDEEWFGLTEEVLYRPGAGDGEKCVEASTEGFYVTGLVKSNVKVPSQLPAPIKWSKP